MTKIRIHLPILIFLSVPIFLIGCQGQDQDNLSESSGAELDDTSEPEPGGTVVIAFPTEPDVLNSLIRISSYSGQILSLMQDVAMEMDENLQWQPRIARDWQLAPDSLAITYHLRPWSWSDGTPLTAYDFAETFRLIKLPEVASPRRNFFAVVNAAVAVDSFTLRYEFQRTIPDPHSRTNHNVLPAHVTRHLEPARIETWSLNEHPLASGPFRLESWDHNHEIVLVPNERYAGVRPLLHRVVFRIIPDETGRVVALETGEVDFMEDLPVLTAQRLADSEKVNVLRVSGRLFAYLSWNFRNPIFADRRVRKAISLGIDRSNFVDGLLGGYAQPAASPLPPALWAHNSQLPADSHDPARARELLDAAGWIDADGDGIREKGDLRLTFEVLTRHGDPIRENGVIIIRENLREVGIEVKPRILEHATALQMRRQGDFDTYLGLFQPNLYVDPSPLFHSQATDQLNHGHYRNAEVDSLLELAITLPDRELAKLVWDRLQEVLADDLPMVFLYYPDTLIGISTRLRNVRPHILSPYNNLPEWWIDSADRKYAPVPQ